MSKNLLSAHLIPLHWSQNDEFHLKRIAPRSIKTIYAFDKVPQYHKLAPKSIYVLRDHALSEQYDDLWKDPIGTGIKHADDWANKLKQWNWSHIPIEQIVVLGINEPHVWRTEDGKDWGNPYATGVHKTVDYTNAMLKRLTQHGIRGGALNLSVGWPANDGKDRPPVWEPYKSIEQFILEGDHFLFLHEYWPHEGPTKHWGWMAGRALKCPLNVPIIIGECGHEERVVNSTLPPEKWGWQGWMNRETYIKQLLQYENLMSVDQRIHSLQIFTWDFSHPFGSTDIRPLLDLLPANDSFDNMLNWKNVVKPPIIDDTFEMLMIREANLQQKIQFNPNAALQKRIFADNFVPNSGEFTLDGHIGQRAEHLKTGEVRVYFAKINQWDNVYYYKIK